ncbi:MAG: hypothetical protein ABI399_01080 [Bauldia sp.]
MFDHLPATGRLVTLRDGDAELTVAPECGARVAAFRVGGRDVLRPATTEGLQSAFTYGFSAFPLLAYSGPVFGDGFGFAGNWYGLGRNVPAEPCAVHGEGWIRPWRILRERPSEICLRLDYEPSPGAFPFAWRGDIAYRLDSGRFVTELVLTNTDRRAMPAGIGFHPYFPKSPGTVLTFNAAGLWPPDAPEAVGEGYGPVVPGLDFTNGLDVDEIVLDRCYEGWDGVARLAAPGGATTVIVADGALGKLQVYDAWDYPYVCIEPVSNANDGFNRAALGVPGHAIAVLQPGEQLAGTVTIYREVQTTGRAAE